MSTIIPPPSAKLPIKSGSKAGNRKLILALSALGACLLLFFGGFFIGRSGLSAARSELAAAKTESAKQVAAAQAQTQQIQGQLTAQQARAQIAEARNLLYRSAGQLDRHNFGSAERDVKQASDILGTVNFETAGFSATSAAPIKESLSAITFTVSADTENQRAQILKAAEAMDALFDATPLPQATPAVGGK